MLTVKTDQDTTFYAGIEDALGAGVSVVELAPEIKRQALAEVQASAEGYRAQLASQSAGKLTEYRIKEEIARDVEGASEAELELLSREAAARGTNRTGLLGIISAKTVAYRQTALLIGVLEAEAIAAITAIPDDDVNIESTIKTALETVKAQSETTFNQALTLINGVS